MRECDPVRSEMGMQDASTLGEVDVQGPDAAEFLDPGYTRRRNCWIEGCALELHPAASRQGGARGRCSHVSRSSWCAVPWNSRVRVFVRSSFSRYLADWLVDAASEYGHGIAVVEHDLPDSAARRGFSRCAAV
ncbi:hypothetical protein [Parasphingorhabdus pacifica]